MSPKKKKEERNGENGHDADMDESALYDEYRRRLSQDSVKAKSTDLYTIPDKDLCIVYQGREVVLVDPQDNDLEYWWPAMVVPPSEIDDSLQIKVSGLVDGKKLPNGSYLVHYFEDGEYSVVKSSLEMCPLRINGSPFKDFCENSVEFANSYGARSARRYLEVGLLPPKFAWTKWRSCTDKKWMLTRHGTTYRLNSHQFDMSVDEPFQPPLHYEHIQTLLRFLDEPREAINETRDGLHVYSGRKRTREEVSDASSDDMEQRIIEKMKEEDDDEIEPVELLTKPTFTKTRAWVTYRRQSLMRFAQVKHRQDEWDYILEDAAGKPRPVEEQLRLITAGIARLHELKVKWNDISK